MPEFPSDLSAFGTLLQSDTLILFGVALLWQQSRFQGKRLDEFREELKDLRAEVRAVNARLDRTDAKMDRVLELLAAQSLTREAVNK